MRPVPTRELESTVSDFAWFITLVAIMGLSIFISLPLILYRKTPTRLIVFLNALAIGIIVFLIADIFSDVAPLIASTTTYLTDPWMDVLFVLGVAIAFAILYFIDNRAPALATAEGDPATTGDFNASRIALIIAIGMGFQNLTEGLLFGNVWVTGGIGLLYVIFLGFFVQNITEGFPIGAPFLGQHERPVGRIVGYFLIGGLPTIAGGALGYYLGTNPGAYINQISVFIDAIAIGALVYVILPMIRVAFRREPTALANYTKQRLIYFGVLAGFLLGFVVNAF